MVDAGIARKVDFGEGRSRFEPSYRHPRHFHLVCNDCHRSSEFLSSDIESLVEEIAAAGTSNRRRPSSRSPVRARNAGPGKTPPIDGKTTELVFARDALRIAIATERSGLEFYTRAAALTTTRAAVSCSRSWPRKEREHLGTLEKRYRDAAGAGSEARIATDVSLLQGRGATGSSPKAAEKLRPGVDDQQALLIGIKCERRLAPVLQALRRTVRGLGRQADLPRICRRGKTRASRPAHPRVPRLARAARGTRRSPRARQIASTLPGETPRARDR